MAVMLKSTKKLKIPVLGDLKILDFVIKCVRYAHEPRSENGENIFLYSVVSAMYNFKTF